jgi:hypothetical protein
MNFKQAYIGFMVVSLLLTIVIAVMYVRRGWCARSQREGFESGTEAATASAEQGKAGLASLTDSLFKTIEFVNKYQKSFGEEFKNERISLAKMSPVELARLHLQSQQPK